MREQTVRAGRYFPEGDTVRSVPSGSYERLSELVSLWNAYLRCRRGKRRKPAMARFDLDADRTVCALHRELRGGRYVPGPYRLRVICDPKTRLIAAAPIRDRIIHQALITELAPHYEPSFLAQSFAWGSGRGPHRALLCFLRLLRTFRYRLSLDIKRYFPSIRHEVLLGLFRHRVHDERTLGLLELILRCGGAVYRTAEAHQVLSLDADPLPPGCGLPIGSYVSQWSGALYLDGWDQFVKRTLHIPGYLRYMDDFSLFSDDREQLLAARDTATSWLLAERGLTVGRKRWEVFDSREATRFVGYRVCQAGIAPGPKVKRRLKKRLPAAANGGPESLSRSIASYRGVFLF
jgi:hypothetical protein